MQVDKLIAETDALQIQVDSTTMVDVTTENRFALLGDQLDASNEQEVETGGQEKESLITIDWCDVSFSLLQQEVRDKKKINQMR